MGFGIVIKTAHSTSKHKLIKFPLTQGYFIAGCDRAAEERQQNHHIHGSGAHGVAPASLSLDQSSQQSDARSGAQTQPLSFDHFDIIIPPSKFGPKFDVRKVFWGFPVSGRPSSNGFGSNHITKSFSLCLRF